MAIEASPPLRTPRLCLRRFRACDAAPLAAYRSVPEVARYQGWEAPYSMEEAQMFVTTMATASLNMPGQWIQIAVALPGTGSLVGDEFAKVRDRALVVDRRPLIDTLEVAIWG